MRLLQRRGEETRRVGQARLGLALEALGQVSDGDLRRDLAVQVAAHAVGDHHQHRVARVASQATRSWLFSRLPMRLSWAMVYFITSRAGRGGKP